MVEIRRRLALRAGLLLGLLLASGTPEALAAGYPEPKQGEWVAKDFRFHTGEVLADMRLSYTTIGEPTGQPVLVLHGTAGSAASVLTGPFAEPLFGPAGPLDAQKYFIIIPDSIGAGRSSKPSDGLRARFPEYNHDDMVLAQYRLVTEGLKIPHLRLVLGNSMGGMHAWLWGTTYPQMADALVPMASQPVEMSSRNWMLRRMIIDAVRNDPDWKGGDYTSQPRAVQIANAFFGIASSGGTLAWQAQAPTRDAADKLLDARLATPLSGDANDVMYQWNASRDYNPRGLERIQVPVLAINSADDERNPPETGLMQQAMAKIPGARLHLIPASTETRGHGTTGFARFWAAELQRFMADLPEPSAR
jgi:homoserine O-acetyltransferase